MDEFLCSCEQSRLNWPKRSFFAFFLSKKEKNKCFPLLKFLVQRYQRRFFNHMRVKHAEVYSVCSALGTQLSKIVKMEEKLGGRKRQADRDYLRAAKTVHNRFLLDAAKAFVDLRLRDFVQKRVSSMEKRRGKIDFLRQRNQTYSSPSLSFTLNLVLIVVFRVRHSQNRQILRSELFSQTDQ